MPDESGRFRYVCSNEPYARTAPSSSEMGGLFDEGRSGIPGERDLRHVFDTNELWWQRYQSDEDLEGLGAWLPFARMLTCVTWHGERIVLDLIFHTEEPSCEVTADARMAGEREDLLARVEDELSSTSLLANIASFASSSLSLEKICERTLSGMRDRMRDLVSGGIYILEGDKAVLRALALFRRGPQLAWPEEVVPVSGGAHVATLLVQGQQLVTPENGVPKGPGQMAEGLSCLEGTRWVSVAIERRGEQLGVLELGFRGGGSFEPGEVRLYQGIAALLGNAIDNARSYATEVRNARIAEGVGRILKAALRAGDEEALGRECLSVLEAITDSRYGFVATLGPTGLLEGIAISDAGVDACEIDRPAGEDDASHWPVEGLYGAVVTSGETLIANEVANHPARAGLPEGHPPLRCFLGTPLVGQDGAVMGIVGLANRPGGYADAERVAVESLAPAIVEAIERFRAERSLAENARFADELNHIESIIHASLDFETIAEEALRTGREALRADTAALSLYEPPNFRVTHAIGFSQDVPGLLVSERFEQHSALAIRSRGPVLVEDVETDDRVNREHLLAYGIRAVMVIPLMVGGKAFGCAYYNFARPTRFSTGAVRFALRLSLSLSLAMENARLYETERTIANRLQEALLALPDTVPAVEFAHAYYPATDAAKVGGDFYDIFELSYGHVGLTIGDVAGKGVDAAALTSLVKNTIRAHAAERGKTPARILRLTNEVLYKTTPVESFVTVFFGMLDTRDGRLVYANGGHTTAAIARPGGVVARLPVTGPLLGAIPDIEPENLETRLDHDDCLFLYTDGLTEARRGGDLYGEGRLFAALSEVSDLRPRKVMHRVVADMMAYSQGRLRDDLAILAVKRTDEGVPRPRQAKLEV